jgi:hypothetical protein
MDHRRKRARRRWLWIAALAAATAGCQQVETPTAPTTGPYTDTFASQLGVRGTAARTFVVSTTGTVSVTLTSIGPPSTVAVGLGLGIPTPTGNGCSLNQSVVATASASPQIAVTADGGNYCVRLIDVGNLTGDVTFSVSVLHP